MTTFYLVGGEDSEFTPSGNTGVDTTTTHFRSAYARCALKGSQLSNAGTSDGWYASLASESTFYVTAQMYIATGSSIAVFSGNAIIFKRGAINTLSLTPDGNAHWRLTKTSAAGTTTTLVSASSASIPHEVLTRLDVFVNYAVSGRFQLYVGGTLVLDYSGDLTTDSATALDGIGFGCMNGNTGVTGFTYWSEIIVADSDTRGMALASLTPLATGNTAAWTGAVTDINEVTLSDTTTASTVTASQLEEFTVTPASTIGSTTGVLAVVVSARAAKGATGPQNLQAAVRTGGADFVSSNLPIAATLGVVQGVFTTNPNTSGTWAGSDLTAAGFNIGLKSIT